MLFQSSYFSVDVALRETARLAGESYFHGKNGHTLPSSSFGLRTSFSTSSCPAPIKAFGPNSLDRYPSGINLTSSPGETPPLSLVNNADGPHRFLNVGRINHGYT